MTVDVKPLKWFALKLPGNHPLRALLLVEEDELPVEEFLVKVKTWLLNSYPHSCGSI